MAERGNHPRAYGRQTPGSSPGAVSVSIETGRELDQAGITITLLYNVLRLRSQLIIPVPIPPSTRAPGAGMV